MSLPACPASRTSNTPLIDGTVVTAHQKASGARGRTQAQAIGRSRDGLTTKIVALADALDNLVRFVLLPGQRHDTVDVPPLIESVVFGALLGDKAFDVGLAEGRP